MPLRALVPARRAGEDGCRTGHSSKLRSRTDVLAPARASGRSQPGQYLLRMAIRWEDRIEDVLDSSIGDDEREALEQRLSGGFEGREPERLRHLEVGVREQRERQVQPLRGLPLVGRVLRRETEDERRTGGLKVAKVVAKSARLRCAAAGAWDRVPVRHERVLAGDAGARIRVHDDASRQAVEPYTRAI